MKIDKNLLDVFFEIDLEKFIKKLFSYLLSSYPFEGVHLYLIDEDRLKPLKTVGNIPSLNLDLLLEFSISGQTFEMEDVYCLPLTDKDESIGVLCLKGKEIPKKEIKQILPLLSKAFKNALEFFHLKVNQNEEKVVIENISEAVAITDTDLNIKDVNASFMEMIGFRIPIVEVLKSNLLDLMPEFEKPFLEKVDKVKENLLPEEITLELIKVKISPVIVDILGERQLKNLVFIFKYPKG